MDNRRNYRIELDRLAQHRAMLTPQEFSTLRGQILSGDVNAAWCGLERILRRNKGAHPEGVPGDTKDCCGGNAR